jgi:hypothetical protein
VPARDPEHRAIVARIAAAERWGRTADRTTATAPARAGLRAKFAREVDPDGTLPPAELERRVDHLVRAHMLRMTLAAKQARRERRSGGDAA